MRVCIRVPSRLVVRIACMRFYMHTHVRVQTRGLKDKKPIRHLCFTRKFANSGERNSLFSKQHSATSQLQQCCCSSEYVPTSRKTRVI